MSSVQSPIIGHFLDDLTTRQPDNLSTRAKHSAFSTNHLADSDKTKHKNSTKT